jgi:hypothetical protein
MESPGEVRAAQPGHLGQLVSAWRCPTWPSRIVKTRLIFATLRALDCREGGMATSYYLAVEGCFSFLPPTPWRFLGEGTVVDPQTIRLLIRAKLQEGRLPRDSTSPTTFGRPGDGRKCDACEESITPRSLMMEVYLLTDDTTPVRLHGDCYIVWNDERRAPQA